MHLFLFAVLLGLGLAPSQVLARDPSPPANVVLDKTTFLDLVRRRLDEAQPRGFAASFFSVADIDQFIGEVDSYLNGVAYDPDYLLRTSQDPNQPARAYTQSRGEAAASDVDEDPRYNGFIILDSPRELDHEPTALHEAIHVFSLARGLGDLDADEYGGPEFLSFGFLNLMTRLKTVEEMREDMMAAAMCGQDLSSEMERLWQMIELRKVEFNDETKQAHELLEHMGGRADWDGYRDAIIDDVRRLRSEYFANNQRLLGDWAIQIYTVGGEERDIVSQNWHVEFENCEFQWSFANAVLEGSWEYRSNDNVLELSNVSGPINLFPPQFELKVKFLSTQPPRVRLNIEEGSYFVLQR